MNRRINPSQGIAIWRDARAWAQDTASPIETLAALIERNYLDPEIGARYAAMLRMNAAVYASIANKEELARRGVEPALALDQLENETRVLLRIALDILAELRHRHVDEPRLTRHVPRAHRLRDRRIVKRHVVHQRRAVREDDPLD